MRSASLRIPMAALAGVAALSIAGCGAQSAGSSAIVEIGGTAITASTLAHWMRLLAPQHVVPAPSRHTAYTALQRRALAFLISSAWLRGEAAALGVSASNREIQQRMREREAEFSGGRAEYESSVRAVAHTIADVKLELINELAKANIRRRVFAEAAKVTAADVSDYYRAHRSQFSHAEERLFDIVENIGRRTDAERIRREFTEHRKSITEPGSSLTESLKRPPNMHTARTIVKAIFAATPHAVASPVKVEMYYFLVKVTKVVPAYVQTLDQARDAIEHKLLLASQDGALAHFTAAWRSRWTTKTKCSAGYMVQLLSLIHI